MVFLLFLLPSLCASVGVADVSYSQSFQDLESKVEVLYFVSSMQSSGRGTSFKSILFRVAYPFHPRGFPGSELLTLIVIG